ncbi:MAG: hypothetical protein IJC88_03185 [Oscillospiraceae bacterium]|nr:hypothetical protein [Oscillospiraceae bacterium]
MAWCCFDKVFEFLVEYRPTIETCFVSIISTLFGFWLSNTARKGRIKIYVNNDEEIVHCVKKTDEGSIESVFPDTNRASFIFSLDVYNSSSDNKIIRDVYILLCDKKKVLYRDKAVDAFIRISSASEQTSNKLINIRPKELTRVSVKATLNKESFDFTKTNRIYMEYQDEKQKTHKVLLKMY